LAVLSFEQWVAETGSDQSECDETAGDGCEVHCVCGSFVLQD
jgi:hypothetical protein